MCKLSNITLLQEAPAQLVDSDVSSDSDLPAVNVGAAPAITAEFKTKGNTAAAPWKGKRRAAVTDGTPLSEPSCSRYRYSADKTMMHSSTVTLNSKFGMLSFVFSAYIDLISSDEDPVMLSPTPPPFSPVSQPERLIIIIKLY